MNKDKRYYFILRFLNFLALSVPVIAIKLLLKHRYIQAILSIVIIKEIGIKI